MNLDHFRHMHYIGYWIRNTFILVFFRKMKKKISLFLSKLTLDNGSISAASSPITVIY